MPVAQPLPATERSSSSRRGGRRGGGAAGSSRRKAVLENDPKTQLLAEWRLHEEHCAAIVIQRLARVFLARCHVAALVTRLYQRQYDPILKQYFYVNTRTNESTWDKPHVLTMFLPAHVEVKTKKPELLHPHEAAKRIQRLARAYVAVRVLKQMIRERYMKLFNDETKTFYYLNTETGTTANERPAFLHGDHEDIEIERFYFRSAVCKVATTSNPIGSGVLGRFCGILCVLSDGKTLPDPDTARAAQVVCNHATDRIPFHVLLASEKLFVGVHLQSPDQQQRVQVPKQQQQHKAPTKLFDFTLCAVNEEQFLRVAGNNVKPLRLELNDRKMGCVSGSMRVQDPLEVVGHPHGKAQIVHTRLLAKMLPNSIHPMRFQYDAVMESGSSGCVVFTRSGKLLGIQSFGSLKEPQPANCCYIKPILDTATELVTPPEPFLLTCCLTSRSIDVYWQTKRWHNVLPGLEFTFELEICHHWTHDSIRHDRFQCVYEGMERSFHIGALQSDAMYTVRCRSVNRMRKSKWSPGLCFLTLPTPSMAWRVAYCSSVLDAVKHMRTHRQDPKSYVKGLQWILTRLDQEKQQREQQDVEQDGLEEAPSPSSVMASSSSIELELRECGGLDMFLDALDWYGDQHDVLLLNLRLLSQLVLLKAHTQRFLTTLNRIRLLCDLLRAATAPTQTEDQEDDEAGETEVANLQVPLAYVALLGYVLDQNDSAKQLFAVCDGVPLVLSLLDRDAYRHQAIIAAECCYLLGIFSFDYESARWEIVPANGLALLGDTLEAHFHDSKVLYWALLTLGNVAYACDLDARAELQTAGQAIGLVDGICKCKIEFLVRVHDLEIELHAAQARLAHLLATYMGEEMRNALDSAAHTVATIEASLAELQSHQVAQAAEYALQYLMTAEQQRVQAAAVRIMKRFLQRQLSRAVAKWCDFTLFERQRSIVLRFLGTVLHRQVRAAFRRWESIVREWRKHKTLLQTLGSGLAMNLTKRKKERYRMLVLQK